MACHMLSCHSGCRLNTLIRVCMLVLICFWSQKRLLFYVFFSYHSTLTGDGDDGASDSAKVGYTTPFVSTLLPRTTGGWAPYVYSTDASCLDVLRRFSARLCISANIPWDRRGSSSLVGSLDTSFNLPIRYH